VDYKDTLGLPRTAFPMKANLSQREPARVEKWDRSGTYRRMVERNGDQPRYILHDGPPYANGHIHSGTVLNKILKDFVVKYKNMSGFLCEYQPGWDCHGLPIENNVEREVGKAKDAFSVAEFRKMCREYALRFVDIQRDEFKRLGALGEWENPYLTLHHSYEATIAREFGKVVGRNALYKKKRPVLWCAHHATALAEAEVEYEELSSPSIWVRFRMNDDARARLPMLPAGKPAYVVIWTTTPWTLPANLAITLHPKLEYSVLDFSDAAYFVATELERQFVADCELSQPTRLGIVCGEAMEKATCRHPFIERDSLIILGDFVSIETGTGCVHTAPGHGSDDYEAGLRYGLDAYAPVDDRGCFTAEVPSYQGRFVFETDADIVAMLREKGALLKARSCTHSYPTCQRCKKPIVFRATSQWFISMDGTGLRERALQVIPKVEWIPARGQQRISSMVELRPDWCLSRQRLWGVPIIAFYCTRCRALKLSQDLVDHVADIFEQEGADAWYVREARDLLPAGTKCDACGHDDFERETDIVDVWFESGVSYAAVIERRYGERTLCDLYLEGSDQHRGWFQSTLLESVLTRNRPPFVTVLTHGFVVDGEGRKISKTLGNYVPPKEIIDKHGAEIYRLWVAAENYQEDVRISDTILKTLVDAYMKVRNTFRFLLGSLDGFDPSTDVVAPRDMMPIDRYILHRTAKLTERVRNAYDVFRFHDIYQQVVQFCAVDLSAFYLDALKDRLYVLPRFSGERRSARAALHAILSALVRMLAPILSFTCEEVWEHMPHGIDAGESVFLARFPSDFPGRYADDALAARFDQLVELRDLVKKKLEEKRVQKIIGHGLDARVVVSIGKGHPWYGAVDAHRAALRELLIVSQVEVVDGDGDGLEIAADHATGQKCTRCWNWSETTGQNEEYTGTCSRCARILSQLKPS